MLVVPVVVLLLAAVASDASSRATIAAVKSEAALPGSELADLGFRPVSNGFSFANYTSDNAQIENLTVQEMRRLFGDEVCATLKGGSCELIPSAQEWMDQANGYMQTGHCAGMAALSNLFYTGQMKPH